MSGIGHAFELVALPNYRGKPLYRSYLIVPASDVSTRSFAELRGKVFAYSDPDSNSGFLVPQYEMLREGVDPPTLFRKTFFTYAHRKVVRAVAEGGRTAVARSTATCGKRLALRSPALTNRTRVAHMSDEYGFPPIVARRSIDRSTYERFRDTLARDAAGRAWSRAAAGTQSRMGSCRLTTRVHPDRAGARFRFATRAAADVTDACAS